jgi:hypothetical protein
MSRLSGVVAIACVAALAACEDPGSKSVAATWSADRWFITPIHAREAWREKSGGGTLWVTGPGISLPLEMKPTLLPVTDSHGVPRMYPNVIMPAVIPAGTEVDVHVVRGNAVSDEVLGKMTVDLASPATEVAYLLRPGSQDNCTAPCDDLGVCNYCKPCTDTYTPGCGAVSNKRTTSSPTVVCNGTSPFAPCTGGTSHACWTVSWDINCLPA